MKDSNATPYYELKSQIDRSDLNQKQVAELIGMDRSLFNVKLNRYEGRDFTLSEAIKISRVLNISLDNFF